MATLEQNLLEWTLMRAYNLDAITYRSDKTDIIDHAAITWPDDSTGVLTTTNFMTIDYQHIPLGRTLSHDASDFVVIEEPPTFDSKAFVLAERPPLVIKPSAGFGSSQFGVQPFGA